MIKAGVFNIREILLTLNVLLVSNLFCQIFNQTIIYRPTVRCRNRTDSWVLPSLYISTFIHRNRTGSWVLLTLYISTPIHRNRTCSWVLLSLYISTPIHRNRTCSWVLLSLYISTSIHRNRTGSWVLLSLYISTSIHRNRTDSWVLPSLYISTSIHRKQDSQLGLTLPLYIYTSIAPINRPLKCYRYNKYPRIQRYSYVDFIKNVSSSTTHKKTPSF